MAPVASSSSSRRLQKLESHLSTSAASAMSSYKSCITSHVLDTSRGRPAANMRITLHALNASDSWTLVNEGQTNADGRVVTPLVPEGYPLTAGVYRLVFATKSYFESIGVTEYFYPEVSITFKLADPTQHYHVPLLINPFGYSTYRGS